MRCFPLVALALVPILAGTGCSGSAAPTSLSAADAEATVADAARQQPSALLGLYDLAIDVAAGTAELSPVRAGTLTQDRYQLPLDSYFKPGDFGLRSLIRTGDVLQLALRMRHPFAAPTDLNANPTASNRADLGIAPRVVLLADLPSAAATPAFTYFGDVIARPDLVLNADGFCQIGDLLPALGTRRTNTYPFLMAVDEVASGVGSRVGIPSGTGMGNYAPGAGGWQRANIGLTLDRWTGYSILHQGQATDIPLELDLNALALATNAPLQLAVVTEYLDPRGGITGIAKRGNRLPGTAFDVTKFVYRMPHGAPDLSRVRLLEATSGLVAEDAFSSATVHFRATDFDARAVASGFATLSDDPNPATVFAGAQGLPTARLTVPGVATNPVMLTPVDDDRGYGGDIGADSGQPEDPFYYSATVLNADATGAQSEGTYWGLVEFADPEELIDRVLYETPVDAMLVPVAKGIPHKTWQAFSFEVAPPTICGTKSFTFTFSSDAEGWEPFGTNSDVNDWSHFRHGCGNAISEANSGGALTAGGTYLSTSDDNDNLTCEYVSDYGPDAINGMRSPRIVIPALCAPGTFELRFNAYLFAAAGATVNAYCVDDRLVPGPGVPVWTQTATGSEQVFANQSVALPDGLTDGVVRLWFTFSGGATTFETPNGALAGLAVDTVELRVQADTAPTVGYTPPDQASCMPSAANYSFDMDAGGWQGGQFFGLPNGDNLATIRPGLGGVGSFRWTVCDAPTDPTGTYAAVLTAAAGAIAGGSLNVSADQDPLDGGLGTGCNYLDDFGGAAAYNIVSPRFVIPALCPTEDATVTWNYYLNSNAVGGLAPSTIRLYVSTDNGASWLPEAWFVNASNGGTVGINQLVYLTPYAGMASGVRLRFEFSSTAGSLRQAATPGQPFGCYIDAVQVAVGGSLSTLDLP